MSIWLSLVLPLVVGLLGSAYAKEVRAFIAYGPRKFRNFARKLDQGELALLRRLHDRPGEIAVYLGIEFSESGLWALSALVIAWLLDGLFGRHINPVALSGGTVFGVLLRVNRVMRHLWNYDYWTKRLEQSAAQ